MKHNGRIYTGLLLAVIFWGMSFVWVDQLLAVGMPSYTLLTIRLGIAAVVLFFISLGLGKLQRIHRRDLKWIVLMALFEPFLYFLGETNGIRLTTPTTASVIISTIPIFALLLGVLVYREKVSMLNIFGTVVAVAGVLVTLSGEGMSLQINLNGVLLLLLAVGAANGFSLIVKKLTVSYNMFTVVLYQNVIGALLFLPFSLSNYGRFGYFVFSFGDFYPLVLLALLPSVMSFLFYVNAIQRIGMARANMFITL
ncbi:MAG: DMT family transporter, partial [Prevotellaceae bacterium]|nr:DMT family transporter [Prevotellaceae bacterium]